MILPTIQRLVLEADCPVTITEYTVAPSVLPSLRRPTLTRVS